MCPRYDRESSTIYTHTTRARDIPFITFVLAWAMLFQCVWRLPSTLWHSSTLSYHPLLTRSFACAGPTVRDFMRIANDLPLKAVPPEK